ncbi:MAG: alpha/beta hydrolase [Deltaproteobacteria bacterium]|nr:alpha/beta hydrolase [Deltaproteobacteria bacterium]
MTAAPGWLTRGLHLGTRAAAPLFRRSFGRWDETWDRPPEQSRVFAGALHLELLHWPGEEPPLVTLHGLNNNAWMWARVASLLAPRTVFSISLRGHGGSDRPADGYDLEPTAGDVRGVLDALGLHRVHLAGHSWGGRVALLLAGEAPERILSLTLADPVPPGGLNPVLRRIPSLVAAAFAPERDVFRTREELEASARRLIYLRRGLPSDRRVWEGNYREDAGGLLRHVLPDGDFRWIAERGLARDLSWTVARVVCPVLLLRPTFTVGFLPAEMRALRRLSRLQVRRIPGDHCFIHSNPVGTAGALEGFLGEL